MKAIDAVVPTARSVRRRTSGTGSGTDTGVGLGERRIQRRSMSVNLPLSTNSYPQRGQRTIAQPRDIGQAEWQPACSKSVPQRGQS